MYLRKHIVYEDFILFLRKLPIEWTSMEYKDQDLHEFFVLQATRDKNRVYKEDRNWSFTVEQLKTLKEEREGRLFAFCLSEGNNEGQKMIFRFDSGNKLVVKFFGESKVVMPVLEYLRSL